jgi:hypothetical protein
MDVLRKKRKEEITISYPNDKTYSLRKIIRCVAMQEDWGRRTDLDYY